MVRALPDDLKLAWRGLRAANPSEALAACRRLREELRLLEGALAREVRDRGSWHEVGKVLEVAKQSAWELYRLGDFGIEYATGRFEFVSPNEIVGPTSKGLRLVDRLVSWSAVRKVVRYLRGDEPHEPALQLTQHGIEVRSTISVALYPRAEDVPQSFQATAERAVRVGHRAPPWVWQRANGGH